MKTTVDQAGRVVIPKQLRDDVGLNGGVEVEIAAVDGRIEIEPVGPPMRMVRRNGLLVAEIEDYDGPPLTAEQVREVLERVRR